MGEQLWRNTFFVLSAILAGLALVQFDAGRLAQGLGDLGASVLMLSLITQFPFLRAVVRASAEDGDSPERMRQRQQELMRQAAELNGRASRLGAARHLPGAAFRRYGLIRAGV